VAKLAGNGAGIIAAMNASSTAVAAAMLRAGTLVLAALLSACAARAPVIADAPPASLLLVSIDAFRADQLDRTRTPRLARLARQGVRARWMVPSYPALTFPNHYTLVTGLRPDRHGIVHNVMRDPTLGTFSTKAGNAATDGRWWGAEPIWVTAQRAGLGTATLFWPGSEAAIGGVRPARWRPYDAAMAPAARVDQVLAWLSEPPATRPRLVTLYFGQLDKAGHEGGPASAAAQAQLSAIDAQVGRLVDELARRGLREHVNLIVVSDHGMAPVAHEHALLVDDVVAPTDATAVSTGEVLGFIPVPGREAAARARLLGRHAGYECWDKAALPARWHYGRHPRVPPVVCQMDEGWVAVPRAKLAEYWPGRVAGAHGYDPALPSMRALFIADGPAFRDGVQLPPFENVDVYPLLARLLGVAPLPNDGDAGTLQPALATP
jgi:predicted AlkP superfamily pyrophosphatase or phosphodiesterase